MLEHGGRVRAAAARWDIPVEEWLDLSTGIAPDAYPVPPSPVECWQRLPEEDDGLEAAAQACYAPKEVPLGGAPKEVPLGGAPKEVILGDGAQGLLALPGSQAAIQTLPRLRSTATVAVLAPSYGEYAAAWQAAGHRLHPFAANELETAAANADVLILGNPNNPTGARFTKRQLLDAARALQARGGWLIVDEAFADAEPEETLAAVAGSGTAQNLIVLRSLGKFFGLAGARVGFAIAAADLLARLAEAVGPWAVSHPARAAARAALADTAWQAMQRQRLLAAGARLAGLLRHAGLGESTGTALFRYIVTPDAARIFDALAGFGILVRRFDAPCALRFGLPGREAEWQRLATALAETAR